MGVFYDMDCSSIETACVVFVEIFVPSICDVNTKKPQCMLQYYILTMCCITLICSQIHFVVGFLKILCVWMFCLYVHICVLCTCLVPQTSEEDVRYPGTGVMDGCELPCGCWEQNLGLLEKHKYSEPCLLEWPVGCRLVFLSHTDNRN